MTRNIADEKEVVWLDDPAKYSYVRYYRWTSEVRDDPYGEIASGLVVGYTTINDDAFPTVTGGRFERRVFMVRHWDRDYEGEDREEGHYLDGCPSQSVDPLTVGPGVEGHVTDKALGRNL